MVLCISTSYWVLGIVYLDQLKVARHLIQDTWFVPDIVDDPEQDISVANPIDPRNEKSSQKNKSGAQKC